MAEAKLKEGVRGINMPNKKGWPINEDSCIKYDRGMLYKKTNAIKKK